MAGSVPETTLRHKQADLYKKMISIVKLKTFSTVPQLDKEIANSLITIKTSPLCSCGRFFEQNPTFIEDTDEVKVDIFLQTIKSGRCKCLVSNRSQIIQMQFHDNSLLPFGKSFVHVAATLGSLSLMRQLVTEADCDINAFTSTFKYTPLSLAVMQTRDEVVKWLCDQPNIQVNASSKSEMHTPLVSAMLAKKFHLVDILIRTKGVDLNTKNFRHETPLILAVLMKNARLVRRLFEAGVDYSVTSSDGVAPLMLAANSGEKVIEEFIKNKVPLDTIDSHGETVLTKSVRLMKLDVTDALLCAGANPRANPALPAFVLAGRLGHTRSLTYFLDIGEDPNQTDDKGWTALHFICLKGYDYLVELLLSYGANPDGSDLCNTSPLGLAIFHRYKDIAKILLARGCSVKRFDNELDTPLHFAAYNGDLDTVQLLLDHSDSTTVCAYNGIGATPLYNAVVSNNSRIVKLLLPYYTDTDLSAQSQGFEYLAFDIKVILFDGCSRSPLWIAASNANETIVKYLLEAGFNMSNEEWIHDGQFPDSLRSTDEMELTDLLIAAASTPSSLTSLSRCAVRRALGPGKQRNANGMNIPRKMKNYIMLRD